ncbi:hypothetical protein HK098_005725 [Nowakowskiella sp. JEL0407]|nr:hypothetical protein HK098_005725 [Nowakowskiella sp. JEL0407]
MVKPICDAHNNYPLFEAVKNDETNRVTNVLIIYGIDVNRRNEDGDTARHIAIRNKTFKNVISILGFAKPDLDIWNKKKLLPRYQPELKSFGKKYGDHSYLFEEDLIYDEIGDYERVYSGFGKKKKSYSRTSFSGMNDDGEDSLCCINTKPIMEPNGKFPDSWSATLRVSVGTLKALLESGKDSVLAARLLTANATAPHPPVSIKISKLKIPRYEEVELEGLQDELKMGSLNAEWVVYRGKSLSTSSRRKSNAAKGGDEGEGLRRFSTKRMNRLTFRKSFKDRESNDSNDEASDLQSEAENSTALVQSPTTMPPNDSLNAQMNLKDTSEFPQEQKGKSKSNSPKKKLVDGFRKRTLGKSLTAPILFNIKDIAKSTKSSVPFVNIVNRRKSVDDTAPPVSTSSQTDPAITVTSPDELPEQFTEESDNDDDKVEIEGEIRPTDKKVIMYIHGGAYFVCSRKTYRILTSKLAKLSGARVLAIDYRLSPEFVFPCALHDVISAYRYLVNPPPPQPGFAALKYSPENITIMGDSAGGNLAFALALWLRQNGLRYNLPMPAGIAGLSPWVDLTHSQPSHILNGDYDYLPYQSRDPKYINENRNHYYTADNSYLNNPLVSPLYANINDERFSMSERAKTVSAKLSRHYDEPESQSGLDFTSPDNSISQPPDAMQLLPPILCQVGSAERLFHENLMFVAKTLEKTPSPVLLEVYEDMIHVHQMFPFEPLGNKAIKQLAAFVNAVCLDSTKNHAPAAAPPLPPSLPSSINSHRFIRHHVKFLNNPSAKCPMIPLETHPLEIIKEGERLLSELKSRSTQINIGGVTLGGNNGSKKKSKFKNRAIVVKMLLKKGVKLGKPDSVKTESTSDAVTAAESSSLLRTFSGPKMRGVWDLNAEPNSDTDFTDDDILDNEMDLRRPEFDNLNEYPQVDIDENLRNAPEELALDVAIDPELESVSQSLSSKEQKRVASGVRLFLGAFLSRSNAQPNARL